MRHALFASAFIALLASPALADDCENTVYAKVATGYVLADLAEVGTTEPVVQGGYTRSCGRFYADVWVSSEIGNGTFGNRGTGDEIDFTVGFADEYESPIGPLEIDVSVSYYALAIDPIARTDDDMIAVQLDIGRPISLGDLTVTPGVYVARLIGTGYLEDLTIARPYVRAAYQINEKWSIDGDVGLARDLTNDFDVVRYGLGATYQATETLSLSLRAEDTDKTETIYSVEFALAF